MAIISPLDESQRILSCVMSAPEQPSAAGEDYVQSRRDWGPSIHGHRLRLLCRCGLSALLCFSEPSALAVSARTTKTPSLSVRPLPPRRERRLLPPRESRSQQPQVCPMQTAPCICPAVPSFSTYAIE